jgi:hypothetical protein
VWIARENASSSDEPRRPALFAAICALLQRQLQGVSEQGARIALQLMFDGDGQSNLASTLGVSRQAVSQRVQLLRQKIPVLDAYLG